jgi:hypothetical protein
MIKKENEPRQLPTPVYKLLTRDLWAHTIKEGKVSPKKISGLRLSFLLTTSSNIFLKKMWEVVKRIVG